MVVTSGWNGSYGSVRPMGHIRHVTFRGRGHAKCAMGPKQSLQGPFWPEITMSEVGFSGTFLASKVTQVTVISICNYSYGPMGPKGHVRRLDLVMGAMKGAQ